MRSRITITRPRLGWIRRARDNSRCNFVILLNNVTLAICVTACARFFLFVVSTDIRMTQIHVFRPHRAGAWLLTKSVKRSFNERINNEKPVPVNICILSTDRSGLSSFYYFTLYLFTPRFSLISRFVYREVVVHGNNIDVYTRGSTVSWLAETKISIEACLFTLLELDETWWSERERER